MEIHFPDTLSHSLQSLQTRLESGWKRLLRQRGLAITLAAASAALLMLLVLWGFEAPFYLPASVKTTFAVLTLPVAALAAWLVRKQLLKPDFRHYYAGVSQSAGNESLRNAMDLHLEQNPSGAFHAVALARNMQACADEAVFRQQTEYAENHPNRVGFRASASVFGALSAVLLLIAVFNPSGLLRTVTFWKTYLPPVPYTFEVTPGDQVIEQGTGFQARIRFDGDLLPKNVSIALKTAVESDFRLQRMTQVEPGIFASEPFSLTSATDYYIQMDRYRSDVYHVEVQLLPRFEELSVTIIPPPHTRLPQAVQNYPFTVVEAYPGTRIQIQAASNKPLATLSLHRSSNQSDTEITPEQDNKYSHEVVTAGVDTLSFQLQDHIGFTNRNPFQFIVQPLTDQFPSVVIIAPEGDLNLLDPETVQIGYEYRDDFGFRSASIHYEIKKAFGTPVTGEISLDRPEGRNDVAIAPFDLEAAGARPLDEIEYWIEVRDNDAVAGFKQAVSQRKKIKLASMAEYLDLVEEKERNVEQELRQMDEHFRDFEQKLERFQEDIKTDQLDDFNKRQTLEELQEKQEQVNDAAKKLREQFEQLKDEFKQNQVLSPETLQQYEELQKLIEDIDSPELREALRQMQESIEQMDPEALRRAMENLEFNEEVYKERLERTLELFRQLKTNAEMDKLARKYEDMAQRQRDLEKEDDLQKQRELQEQLQKELKDSEKNIDALDKDAPNESKDSLKELQEKLKQDSEKTGDQMQQRMDSMDAGDESQQQDGQNQDSPQQPSGPAESLEQMAASTRSSMQAMGQQQNQINIQALRYVLRTLLLLSETQEEIATQTAIQPFRSNGFVDLARTQNTVNQTFGITMDTLLSVASRVPQLSNHILEKKTVVQQNLNSSMTYLAERDNANASAETRFTLAGINELATLIANLLDQMQNQGGGGSGSSSGSMMQQLQDMSGQQQQLNQMLQDMINDMQGERLTNDQMERFNQMARQQNEIRRQLEEMRRNGDMSGDDPVMKELERIAQEMEDAINDIRGGRTDRTLVRRQQNILSRMLEAEKALQERDEDEKRKGNTADPNLRAVPPELTLEELRKRIRSRLSDPNMSRFSDDYQKLIEKYFEVLERRERR